MAFMPFDAHPARRTVLGGLAAAGAAPALAAPARTVALFGDSITAGYGLPARDALPAQLERELTGLEAHARIRPLGVSGDTTGLGLARLDRAMAARADLWIVALGGNDLLRGVDPRVTRANLDRIVSRLAASGAGVVLAGVQAPVFLGGAYAVAFNAAFAEVARGRHVAFMPDMLAGVAGVRALNQADGIHPNAAGVRVIAQRMAPLVVKALAQAA
jgi:acyl-CoA thioesterase-1